jgi:hypothetical protein
VIIFYSVRFFIKKNNQIKIFFLKKKTETWSNRPVSVRFLGQKPVQTGLARFWLGFLDFGLVFSVWLGFSGLARFFSIRFGFFGFFL